MTVVVNVAEVPTFVSSVNCVASLSLPVASPFVVIVSVAVCVVFVGSV